MKKIWLSLAIVLVGLLVWAYAAPVSPFAVANSDVFSEENNPWVCSVFQNLYLSYSIRFDHNAFILKPLAHLCLSAQLRNIHAMDSQILQSEVDYLIEVYNLDIDNIDRAAYRQKHIDKFEDKTLEDNAWMYVPHLSLSFTEEEIFNLLLWSVEKSRRMLLEQVPDQYETCQSLITEDTDPSSLSDEQWECIKLAHKIHAKYGDRYNTADEYGLE